MLFYILHFFISQTRRFTEIYIGKYRSIKYVRSQQTFSQNLILMSAQHVYTTQLLNSLIPD